MSKAGTTAATELLADGDVTFFHEVAMAAQKAMAADVDKAFQVFYNL